MSASPAGQTPGRTSTPNGGPLPPMRRPKKPDPMVKPKKRATKPIPSNGMNGVHPNGVAAPPHGLRQGMPHNAAKPLPTTQARPSPPSLSSLAHLEGTDVHESGFSSAPLAPYTDYPIVTTKRALMEGLRHHVLRFASKKLVDPTDEHEFLRPVRLHRRDPRLDLGSTGVKGEDENEEERDEREKREKAKEEREKQKEADAAMIAPSADKPVQKKTPFGKRIQPVYSNNQTEFQKAQSKVKYEETLPWHLEDDENKSVWVGNYEQALSGSYAALAQGPDGAFRVIPLEKWYRFTPKNKFKALTIEEAEKMMGRKAKKDKWTIEAEAQEKVKQEYAQARKEARGLFTGKISNLDRGTGRPNIKTEAGQVDDLDFEEDRFADDEETPFMEGALDTEEKDAENKIKREQLEANVFDMRDEQDYDMEEKEQQRAKRMLKETGRKVKKAIVKREKNFTYDGDSDADPYSSKSESEDTETEMLKEEERKKEEEEKKKATASEKPPKSSASSHGTNTPSGRPGKHSLLSTQGATSKSLKRPGSPNLSEASGNESSRRKKIRKPDGQGGSQPIQPPSRPMSPNVLPPSSSAPEASRPGNSRTTSNFSRHPRSNAGSGSEDNPAGSGGEMSDGARRKQRLKLTVGSKPGSPKGSRGASPERGPVVAPPSRTGTPANTYEITGPPVSAGEIRAAIPPEGCTLPQLLAHFKGRVGVGERKKTFTEVMRANSTWDSKSKLLGQKN